MKITTLFSALIGIGLLVATPVRSAPAVRTLAVLQFNDDKNPVISLRERQQLVETVRGIARRNLSRVGTWTVLTREKVETQIPAGSKFSNCSDEACILSAGHELQVDYVVAGNIGRIGSSLQASFSLYDIATGQLIGSEWPRGKTADDIIDALESNPDQLFTILAGPAVAKAPAMPSDNSTHQTQGAQVQPAPAQAAVDTQVIMTDPYYDGTVIVAPPYYYGSPYYYWGGSGWIYRGYYGGHGYYHGGGHGGWGHRR